MKTVLKKIVLAIVVMVELVLGFTSCSKKIDIVDPTDHNEATITIVNNTIIYGL